MRRRVLFDPRTGQGQISLITGEDVLDRTDGPPLLDWNRTAHDLTQANLQKLLDEGRVLHPNLQQPMHATEDVLTETGEQIDPKKLASFGLHGELILHRRATEELWPHFVAQRVAPGLRGLFFACLLAVAWLVVENTLRLLSQTSSRIMQRPAFDSTLQVFMSMCLLSLAAATVIWVAFPGEWCMVIFASTLVPVAGVVLLGMTSRYASPAAAGIALITGCVWTFMFGVMILRYGKLADAGFWSFHPAVTIPFAFFITLVIGHSASIMVGKHYPRNTLRGLVLGAYRIGDIRPEEPSPQIIVPEANDSTSLQH
jgi:hypothetical protein